ncbi:M protein [Streptococcus pyogenes]|uniref:M protein n=1 Tax=Streptococcus pyogenes TaxID=1314 RepID=UPI000DA40775|nr:M protein [Streptococcus pyogenes]SQF51149.1 M protein [Streptococcus pyogenes]
MAKNNTNRHYSLRKLKTGTASVAVALTVLGTGLASQTEVKADGEARDVVPELVANNLGLLRKRVARLQAELKTKEEKLRKLDLALGKEHIDNIALKHQLETEKREAEAQRQILENEKKKLEEELANKNTTLDGALRAITEKEEKLRELDLALGKEHIDNIDLKHQLETEKREAEAQRQILENEKKKLEEELANKNTTLDGALRAITEKEEKLRELDLALGKEHIDNIDLKHQLETEKREAEAQRQILENEKKKLEEQNKISEASRKGLRRDLDASREAKKQLEAEHQKLEEQNKISEASRKGLRRDLDASREAKKQVEKDLANLTAELDKVKEEKQISDASRQGLRRDLDASREAKKQVEKALEEANSKLAALEKLNKELEESKKLTEKEKAELQAKLEAEAKALKEQLAKQAEELAKLRAGKASGSQTPDAKPGNKAVPGKGQAPQAGAKPNQNKAPMKETKRQLPSTGETANPFFTAAALTVMATAGVAAVVKRKEEN